MGVYVCPRSSFYAVEDRAAPTSLRGSGSTMRREHRWDKQSLLFVYARVSLKVPEIGWKLLRWVAGPAVRWKVEPRPRF